MVKLIRYLFWNVVYCLQPRSTEFIAFLARHDRCRWPWKQFRPSVWHNDNGNLWHVYLADKWSYTEPRTLKLDCHVDMESGDIVGFNVWDEVLKVEAKGGE